MLKLLRLCIVLFGIVVFGFLLSASPTATIQGLSGRTGVHTIPNPAAYYCETLGYDYQVQESDKGQQGVCQFSDGSSCDAWQFLQGQCGVERNYCAQQGLTTRVAEDGKNGYSRSYAVCVGKNGQVAGSATDLMDFRHDLSSPGCENSASLPAQRADSQQAVPEVIPGQDQELPASFDWRDFEGSDWMTPVKDQGICGSCWAFAAVGAVEAAFNIGFDDPNLDLDLAEEYLVSDCYSVGTCCGGGHPDALNVIRSYGIPDEACLPYIDGSGCTCYENCANCTYFASNVCSDTTCSDRCSDWSSRLVTIDSVTSISAEMDGWKHALVENGPLAVSMAIDGYWDGDTFRCDPGAAIQHSVILTGYDDGRGSWIAKNSWGSTWDEDGYFYVGYGECSMNNAYLASANFTSPPQPFGKLGPPNLSQQNSIDVLLEWEDSVGAMSYEYCFDTIDDGGCNTEWIDAGDYLHKLQGLETSQTYFWQVRGVNPYGSTEANNGDWWSFTTRENMPDLVIDYITWTPDSPVIGQPVDITVRITNTGEIDVPAGTDFLLDVYLDHQPQGCGDHSGSVASWSISSVPPFERQDHTFTYPGFSEAGTHDIVVFIDSDCEVEESYEPNNITPARSIGATDDSIFSDGFESGNLSAWSSCRTDAGDLSARAEAALIGNYGMRAVLDDNNAIYCISDHPNDEKVYRARFYFDPNSIRMAEGNTQQIFLARGAGKDVLRIEFRRQMGQYQVRTGLLTDSGTWKYTIWFNISDAKHYIETFWKAAESTSAHNGGTELWIDGTRRGQIYRIDNDTLNITRVLLGAISGIDPGTRGRYYFDEFVSRRGDQPIGP